MRDRRSMPIALVLAGLAMGSLSASSNAFAQAFTTVIPHGDVMASIGAGQVQVRKPDGSLDTSVGNSGILDDTSDSGETTGSAFDSSGNFLVTDFTVGKVSKFDPSGNFLSTFGSGFNNPESILVDKEGNFLVGDAGGNTIKKFDPAGTLLNTFVVKTEDRGTDWIDLDSDQCTLFYTSEGSHVMRFDICTNTQLSDFNGTLLPTTAYGLRLLPSGGLLVADTGSVIRLGSSGDQIKTYAIPNASVVFALNLDPDGTSFWTADLSTAHVFKVDIASGNVLLDISTGAGEVAGLSVKGEITVSTPASAVVTAPQPQTVSGSPGKTVDSGGFDLTNNSAASESFNSLTISLTDAALFSSLTLTATIGEGSQAATVTPPTATTVFTFNPPLVLAAGQTAHFDLTGTISASLAMGEQRGVAYAQMVPSFAISWNHLVLALAITLMALSLIPAPVSRRRRVVVALAALVLLGATQAGCDPCGSCSPMVENKSSSTQTVTAASGTNQSDETVKVDGLPATLDTVTVN
jgi:sugar lactone lactonase YvrE